MLDLSIIIPTYNRKERLVRQLRSIFAQELSKDIKIIILDNHSDYNVEDALSGSFDHDELNNLKVIRHKANLGLSLNISLPFYYCDTKWLWILSDDDETLPNSLEIIKKDMFDYSDYAVLKYSLGNMSIHNDVALSSLEELVSYYERKDKDNGEFIFISNNLFNMDKIKPYIGTIVSYSYNAIAGILPAVYILDNNDGEIFMRSAEVVRYLPPQSGKEWKYIDITTRLVTLVDYPYKSNGQTISRLMDLMSHFSYIAYLDDIIKLNDRKKARIFYEKTFGLLFKNGFLLRSLYRVMFYVYYFTGADTVKLVRSVKRSICK